ncbi:MAG: FixH family protein [Hyphomicrobiaceae bacterium]|nr:FixH family protein [Hyphomicrobiaceae bacterium]
MAEGVITGRHVLIGMLVFFGVILGVNGMFLYSALSTYTGVVSDEPYRKGLNYNERIEAYREQEALGWTETVELAATGDTVHLTLTDHGGNPVSGIALDVRLGRPSTNAKDRMLPVKEAAPGQYDAQIEGLEPGVWQLDIAARQLSGGGDKIVWRARKRLTWKQP